MKKINKRTDKQTFKDDDNDFDIGGTAWHGITTTTMHG